jgi:signal transduction histidine kinase
VLASNPDSGETLISVEDNGIGIEPDNKKNIFIPHFTTKSTGSGIGLSLVKQIIENHGGEITFTSALNEGSVFTFSIP